MNDLTLYEWVCERCTLINKKSKASCAACGCTQKSWFCIRCGYKNRSDETFCVLCRIFKPPSSPVIANITANNSRICTSNQMRTGQNPLLGNVENTWICENCLGTNMELADSCRRCEQLGFIGNTTAITQNPPSSKENSSKIINSHRSQLLEEVRQREEETALKYRNEILYACRIVS